jgi:inorganic pyrophosphatase
MIRSTDFLGKLVTVQVERTLGSRHPVHNIWYMVNYGFIPGVPGLDGDPLDAYVLGVFEPVERFRGMCIAVIHRTNDADDKLVVVPPGVEYSDDQIRALTEFQERFFESVILRSADLE